MQVYLPFSTLVLTGLLLAAYIFSFWWLIRGELKREHRYILLGLLIITICTEWLHLHQIWQYPPGLNDDEVKTLKSANEFFAERNISRLAIQGPGLLAVLFQQPLVRFTDSLLWSMRLYPIIFGILAVPLSYCVGRALLFRPGASLSIAALVGTLPWSLFWGRLPWGGEVFFYQALLIAALARIIWCGGGWIDVVVGALGLSGLVWDYTGAWAMLALPFIGILVAHSMRQRALCLAIFFLATILWIPYLLNFQEWWQHISSKVTSHPATGVSPVSTSSFPSHLLTAQSVQHFREIVDKTLRAFIYPEGNIYWISMHSVALHPQVVLIVAGLGVLAALVRRSLLIIFGFAAGLTPTLLSFSGAPSTHRMITAFIFIPIACGALFELLGKALKGRLGNFITTAISIAFITVSGYQSAVLFFSPSFWISSERIFSHGETLASEEVRLPVATPIAVDFEIFRFLDARGPSLAGVEILGYENLLPNPGFPLILSPATQPLIPFYKAALPSNQVVSFGTPEDRISIRAVLDKESFTRLNQYGWIATRFCNEQPMPPLKVPTVYTTKVIKWGPLCHGQRSVVFKGRWIRPSTEIALKAFGDARVTLTTSQGVSLSNEGNTAFTGAFTINQGESVTLNIQLNDHSAAWLTEGASTYANLPRLESFEPVATDLLPSQP